MTAQSAVRFYKRYEGLLTPVQMFEETGVSMSRIRSLRIRNKGQLCWTCANACSDLKCEWVRNCRGDKDRLDALEHPDFVETVTITMPKRHKGRIVGKNLNTFIVKCEHYEKG